MKSVPIDDVINACNKYLGEGNIEGAERIIHPALEQNSKHPGLLFAAGNIEFKREHWAVARILYERSVSIYEYPGVYSNLGAACRRMQDVDSSLQYLLRCIELEPTNESALTNLAACYVNEGMPEHGIKWAQKALAKYPKAQKARWNLGLMQLESGDYLNGFKNYRSGIAAGERMMRFYDTANAIPMLETKTLEEWRAFRAEHGRKPKLIIWGEQGIGDEVMFASIIPDAMKDFDLVFECHPRLESIFNASFGLPIYGTRKQQNIEWPIKDKVSADCKAPIGDLACLYRQDRESFNRSGSYLTVPGKNVVSAHEWIEAHRKGRKVIGFAWSGGVAKTNMLYRSINAEMLKPLMADDRVFPICLEYNDASETIDQLGVDIAYPQAALSHHDYEHTAALIQCCDAIVTVNTSVVHMAGALGVPAYILTPSKPAWRYTCSDELVTDMAWYPQHRQYRQQGIDWAPAVDRLITDIREAL